jgi:catechol 2,3-dioxygenase-like lactoylglutathione lyase family enzyme
MPNPTITAIAHLVIPVTDQDRALAFYTERLGFETRTDAFMDEGLRWIEVALPGAQTSLALVPPRGGMFEKAGVDTRVCLTSPDLSVFHGALSGGGVDVDAEILRLGPGVPAMFFFRDPDGNTLQVIEGN